VTTNQDFKVTLFFDVKYLENDTIPVLFRQSIYRPYHLVGHGPGSLVIKRSRRCSQRLFYFMKGNLPSPEHTCLACWYYVRYSVPRRACALTWQLWAHSIGRLGDLDINWSDISPVLGVLGSEHGGAWLTKLPD